jgi:hypothetical protein|tara:strand:+ start:998 stop:1504 length:507 start_codon:yes stop_codon:yes gene_type:complete
MNLIEIVNNVAIPSPYTLTILEFKELDTKELAYVFFMCDHTSPFAVYGVEQRHEEVKLSIYGKSKWTASSKVNAACDKYRKLKETSAVKLLKAARHSIVKLERYFDTVDLTLLDDNGKPIYHAKDLVANLSKMGDVVDGLIKLEDQVKKQEQVNTNARGGVVVNKYSS